MSEPLVQPSEVCHRAFGLMQARKLEDAEKLLTTHLAKTEDPTALALYHSALGVLCKFRQDYKAAWRHYQRAEKLLPDDPALKIIVARLLIEQFAEYGAAIKRARKVLDLVPKNPVFVHQAFVTMGLAHVKKAEKKKALECLKYSHAGDFAGFVSANNIDFNLVEALLRKSWGREECRVFVAAALAFAQQTGEQELIDTFQKMLNGFSS